MSSGHRSDFSPTFSARFVCDKTRARKHGFCRTNYGPCTSSCDCAAGAVCVSDKDTKLGMCICSRVDESTCGKKCTFNEDCDSKCEICSFGQCTRTPGIAQCAEETKDCARSDKSTCVVDANRECCSNCDCAAS